MPFDTDNRFRATLDSLLEGFQVIGTDWTYVYVNPAAAAQGMSTPDRLIGRKMWDAYPGIRDSDLFPFLEGCMERRVAATRENLFQYPDGTSRWFELRVEPVPEGICIHSFDVQSRMDAQHLLEKLNAELEARVAARTLELEERNAELNTFAYTVSHDLKAPVRHISGFADILGEDAATRLSETDKSYLGRITAAASRMSTMIDSLLAFSQLGIRPLARQPVSLAGVVRSAKADVEPDAAEREVVWLVDDLPEIPGDPALLHLAFVNLFQNALKFTRGRTPATITVSAHQTPLGELVISVKDNGAGFDMKRIDKLFGVFQRLHNAADFEGTGVGLASVRRIIARHGGRTWGEGSEGIGATFSFSLPITDVGSVEG